MDCHAPSYRSYSGCRYFFKIAGNLLQSDIRSLFTRKDASRLFVFASGSAAIHVFHSNKKYPGFALS